MVLAKFFDGMSLSRRRDLQQHGSVRDDGGDGVRDYEPLHYLQLLTGTYTFHSSSAPDPSEFRFLVPVKWRIIEDEAQFLADK